VNQRAVVGRDAELAAFHRFITAEDTSVLLLEGEAGIGKTTLWLEAIALGRACGLRVLSCRPTEAEARLSFAGLGDLLEDVLDELLTALEPARRSGLEAAMLLGDRAEVVDERAIGLAVRDGLRALGRETGVLVAVDDWQWLDESSAKALTFAARRLGGTHARFLCGARVEAGTSGAEYLRRALDDRQVEVMRIGALEPGALHRLLASRLGISLARPPLLRLHEASRGNPFLALEIGRSIIEEGHEIPATGPFPVGTDLQTLLRKRVSEIPRADRRVLEVAALLTSPAVGAIERIIDDSGVARTALDEGVDHGVVVLEGDTVRFAHPLLASALLSGVSPEARRDIHAQIAANASDAEERTRHLALAADGPDETVAAALEGAAERASARGAASAAAELSDMALDATPLDRSEDRTRRVFATADYLYVAGDGPHAQRLLEGMIEELSAGPTRARALERLAAVAIGPDLGSLCEQALAEAGDDAALLATIHMNLGGIQGTHGEYEAYRLHTQMAAELARRAGDTQTFAVALGEIGLIRAFAGEGPQRELLEPVLDAPAPTGLADAAWSLGRQLLWAGELDEARPLLKRSLQRAVSKGDIAAQNEVLLALLEVELRSGRWTEADRLSTEALELAEQMEISNAEPKALGLRALVEAHLGQIVPAREHGERALVLASEMADVHAAIAGDWALGFTAFSLGDTESAARILEPLPERSRALGNVEPGVFQLDAVAIEAQIAVGEVDRATPLIEWLEEFGRTRDRAWALAASSRCRALALAESGDLQGAIRESELAIEHHARIQMPFELARTLLVQGAIQRRAKLKRSARETLERAVAIFEELGAPLWAGRARAELSRIGGRQPAADGVLTATERRVAELAANGRTNKQIAAELFLSERTVEANLTKIYRKLGIRSRTQLAAAWTAAPTP
jgi:DNA-binding CsgD family transcriptional regulator/tetratricopeptide (TPR) repeat protein